MFGTPTETKAEVMDTVNMVRHIRPEFPSLFIFSPFPGDDLSEYCRQNDLIMVGRHASYSAKEFTPKIKGVDYRFIAHAIEEALGEDCGNARISLVRGCPDCGYPLKRESGCDVCSKCAYTKCG